MDPFLKLGSLPYVRWTVLICAYLATVLCSNPKDSLIDETSNGTSHCANCNLQTSPVSATVNPLAINLNSVIGAIRVANVTENLRGIEQKKREISDKLPIEALFPTVDASSKGDSNSTRDHLKSTLLNQTLHLDEIDKDLDSLVFSHLPQGSKLILRTVKIVRTDGDGDEDEGEEATEWNVLLKNKTGGTENFGVEIPQTFYTTNENLSFEPVEKYNLSSVEISDLIGAASHQTSPSSHYTARGSHRQSKDKSTTHHNQQNHGNHAKKTITDTNDKSVTNYKGKEAGLTDFARSHGDSQNKEGGRFKDSKKKNKGRKVTGFKRVYHKEEFQRTEHFYDDEEAKRIAESFGANDQNEKSSHGLKNDDRKYHGVHKEDTDGIKVQKEHGTSNSHDKGTHHEQKHAEHHDRHQNHASHHSSYPKHHNSNHNYHGASSTDSKQVVTPQDTLAQHSSSLVHNSEQDVIPDNLHSSTTPPVVRNGPSKGTGAEEDLPNDQRQLERPRPRPSSASRPRSRSRSKKPQEVPSMAMTAPPLDAKPTEMKVFFSPRKRHFPFSTQDGSMAYGPNFRPSSNNEDSANYQPLQVSITSKPPRRPPPSPSMHSSYSIHGMDSPALHSGTVHRRPLDPAMYLSDPPHYYLTGDPAPPAYSTLAKTMPQRRPDPYNPWTNSQVSGNLISVAKANVHEVGPINSLLQESSEHVPSSTGKSADIAPGELASKGRKTPPGSTQALSSSTPSPGVPRPQIGWIPLGQPHPSGKSKHHHHPHVPILRLPFSLNPFRLGKTLIPNMFHRHNHHPPGHSHSHSQHYQYYNNPGTQQQAQSVISSASSYRSTAARPVSVTPAYYPLELASSSKSTTKPPSTTPFSSSRQTFSNSHPAPYNKFVNNIMDSVADFFSTRVG